ncbi:MAG TPA: transcription antitermination factor NusB, partial [Thermoanaerobaculia bacterium]|nr:transcription antitermination factor NusB [Thermoanaerobaculia bacterium]
MTDRERALLLLRRIERESSFASPLLHNETGFVRTLVLGVLRWRSRIDHAIATLASRRIEKLDPVVVELLRLGLYQLMFMDVAPHAAVNETVDLAGQYAKRARGFVNAVLRNATRTKVEPDSVATATAHPPWLIERWTRAFGAER